MKDVNCKYVVKTEIGLARITIRRVRIKDTKTIKHTKERHHNEGGEGKQVDKKVETTESY
jgi:hypothetical protein